MEKEDFSTVVQDSYSATSMQISRHDKFWIKIQST